MIQAAETASTNPLLPSWPEFIIGTILFLIVFGALAKFLLPRATKMLAERTGERGARSRTLSITAARVIPHSANSCAAMPPAGSNNAIVGHGHQFQAVAESNAELAEGEAAIVKADGKGGFKVVARIGSDEWSRLQGAH